MSPSSGYDPEKFGKVAQQTDANSSRIKTLEGKVDKILWLSFALLAALVGNLIRGVL